MRSRWPLIVVPRMIRVHIDLSRRPLIMQCLVVFVALSKIQSPHVNANKDQNDEDDRCGEEEGELAGVATCADASERRLDKRHPELHQRVKSGKEGGDI